MKRFRDWLGRIFNLVPLEEYVRVSNFYHDRRTELMDGRKAAEDHAAAVIACRLEDEARYAASAAELRKTLDKFIDELAAKNRQICELDEHLTAEKEQLAAAKRRIDYLGLVINDLNEKLALADAAIEAKDRALADRDGAIAHLRSEVEHLEGHARRLSANLEAAKDREKVHLKMLRDRERPRRDTKTGRYAKRCSP